MKVKGKILIEWNMEKIKKRKTFFDGSNSGSGSNPEKKTSSSSGS